MTDRFDVQWIESGDPGTWEIVDTNSGARYAFKMGVVSVGGNPVACDFTLPNGQRKTFYSHDYEKGIGVSIHNAVPLRRKLSHAMLTAKGNMVDPSRVLETPFG